MLPTVFPPLSTDFDSDEGGAAGCLEHAAVKIAARRTKDAFLSMGVDSLQELVDEIFLIRVAYRA